MKMTQRKLLFICFCTLFVLLDLSAQSVQEENIINRFVRQLQLFPQEKIHLHIDKPKYLSGERIWVKAFLVNAALHTPSELSQYVYIELLDPLQTVVVRVKIRKDDESYHGYLDLPEELSEGTYILRAYTHYMKNWNEEYWPHLPVLIFDPQSEKINITSAFNDQSQNRINVELKLENKDEAKTDETLSITYNNEQPQFKKIVDGNISFSLKLNSKAKHQVLSIEYNGYKKYIPIPNLDEDYEVSLFPEGGNLIVGEINSVAFKAISGKGMPINVKGELIDDAGKSITDVNTYHDGMGLFSFRPEKEKSYYLLTKNKNEIEKRTSVPLATEGHGLKINNNGDLFYLSVSTSTNHLDDSLYLIAHCRGVPFYVKKLELKLENKIALKKVDLPTGVLHFILMHPSGQIWSERLVFNNNMQELIKVETPLQITTRGPVSITLKSLDKLKKFEANLSVSVTDDRHVDANSNESILSSLLLTSEIRGYIPNPNFYFETGSVKANVALDLLMLTHGWRRYDISKLLKGEYEEPTKAELEVGQEISGQVVKPYRHKGQKNALVSIFSKEVGYLDTTTTDEEGRFYFRHFEFPDSTSYILQALSESGSNHLEIVLDRDRSPASSFHIPLIVQGNNDNSIRDKQVSYIREANQKYTIENGMRTIHLPEFEVLRNRKLASTPIYYHTADNKFSKDFFDEMGVTKVSDIMNYIPGVYMENGRPYLRRSQNLPMAIYVDGVRIDDFDEEANPLIDMQLDYFTMDDIETIFVYRTAGSSVVFGPAASNGAIMITTKKGVPQNRRNDKNFNIVQLTPLSYQKPVEFYSPQYDTPENRYNPTPDLRSTIYWNPTLKIKEGINTSFDFYAADQVGSYTLKIEGVTTEGELIHFLQKLKIE